MVIIMYSLSRRDLCAFSFLFNLCIYQIESCGDSDGDDDVVTHPKASVFVFAVCLFCFCFLSSVF